VRVSPDLRNAAADPEDPVDRLVLERFRDRHPQTRSTRVAVVIPAYDEEATIAEVIEAIPSELGGEPPTIIVVSDGSRDRTAQVAEKAGALVLDAPINRGQGAALRLGYLAALRLGARIVGIVDADGQWDPSDLAPAVDVVAEGLATFVQGSRVLGSSSVGDPVRDLGVVVFARVVSVLIGTRVTDTSSGIRVLSSDLLGALRLDQPQYQSAELLITAAFAGARIVEIPVALRPRSAGTSKKGRNLRYGASYAWVIARTYVRERWLAPR
jgi:glycosyltransferase involved in cell wall biosynthesis